MSKRPKEGGTNFIRNVGNYKPDYTCVMGLNLVPWKPNLAMRVLQSGSFTAWPRSCSRSFGCLLSVKHETSQPLAGTIHSVYKFYLVTKVLIVKVPLTDRRSDSRNMTFDCLQIFMALARRSDNRNMTFDCLQIFMALAREQAVLGWRILLLG